MWSFERPQSRFRGPAATYRFSANVSATQGMTFGCGCAGADADDSFRRRANWHLCPFRCVRRRATRACPHAPFSHRQSPRTSRVLQVTSAAHRIASGSPSFPLPPRASAARDGERSSRADGPLRRVRDGGRGAEARHVVGHGEPRRRRVRRGAGDVHSEYVSVAVARARVRVDSPPHRPSRTHPFFCHLERGGCPRRRPRRRPRAASERSARKRATRARVPSV